MKLFREKSGSGVIRSRSGTLVIMVILFAVAAFMLLPFYYAIIQSLKPMEEIFAFPPRFYVINPSLESYRTITELGNNLWIPFWRYAFNSIAITVIGTVLVIIISSLGAFPLAKYDFPGKNLIFNMIVLSLLFVGPTLGLPRFIIISELRLYNTFMSAIIPSLASSMGLFLMKNFMEQISDSIIEAAKIDGAGTFRIYWQIFMPLVKPAWLTVMILSMQSFWNGGNAYIYDEDLKTLPTALSQIASSGMARSGVSAAVGIILMIPPMIFFILSQRSVVETMASSGIKG